MQVPQMQAPVAIQTLDTPVPMDIDQNCSRPDTCICYNCGDKGHLSHTCLKLQKQQIRSTALAKVDLKRIIAKAVMAAMDVRDVANKAKQAKESEKVEEDFQAGKW